MFSCSDIDFVSIPGAVVLYVLNDVKSASIKSYKTSVLENGRGKIHNIDKDL